MAEKGGYPDFMLKEIHEQPRVVRDTLVGRMTPAGELISTSCACSRNSTSTAST